MEIYTVVSPKKTREALKQLGEPLEYGAAVQAPTWGIDHG
jgi:hypothetical protein